MKNLNTGEYKRVRKDVARKLFEAGKTIYLTPANVVANDSNPWIRPCAINNKGEKNFNALVNTYECYNCNYQLGYYIGYYTNFWINKKEEEE